MKNEKTTQDGNSAPAPEKCRFFPMLFRQKYIRRWGIMRSATPESLAEHVTETAVIAHALAVIGKTRFDNPCDPARVALLALYHDAAEVYTGDLPTPVKYFNARSRDSYREIEANAIDALLEGLPPLLREEYEPLLRGGNEAEHRLVKAADKLCAYIKCVEEEKSGNREFRSAGDAALRLLREMNCPEAAYFMEHFLPAFSLTLDELQ